MGQILEGPWPRHHKTEHELMFDSLVKLIFEFDAIVSQNYGHLARREDGHLDLAQVPVQLLLQWAALQAQKPTHEHGENGEIKEIPIR